MHPTAAVTDSICVLPSPKVLRAAESVLYDIPHPYTSERLQVVSYRDGFGCYEFRVLSKEGGPLYVSDRSYGVPEIALRDVLNAASTDVFESLHEALKVACSDVPEPF